MGISGAKAVICSYLIQADLSELILVADSLRKYANICIFGQKTKGGHFGGWVTVGEKSSPRDGGELISCWVRVAEAGIKDMNRELMQKILTPLTLSPLWALSFVPFWTFIFPKYQNCHSRSILRPDFWKIFLPQWQSVAAGWPLW